MKLTWWIGYVTTVLILMSTPGPSYVLILSNSLAHGYRKSMATMAGDLSANLLQMTVAAAGLVTLVQAGRSIFLMIKWAGVSYLVYMGISQFVKSGRRWNKGGFAVQEKSRQALYWQGFITSATNPKAIIFFAALFPQFLIPTQPLVPQFIILSMTFLTMDACFLMFYGGFASLISGFFNGPAAAHLNRVSGTLLVVAAVILGLKDIDTNAV